MSETLVQFLISPLVLLVVGWLLNRRVKAIQAQVENDHETNMRDDMDGIHSEIRGLRADISTGRAEDRGLHKDLGSVRADITQIRLSLSDLARRIDHLEAK